MRITESMSNRTLLDNLTRLNEEMDEAVSQVSSGKRVRTLRDGPEESAELIRLRDQADDLDQYRSNASSGAFLLGITDSTLSEVYDTLTSIYTLGSSAATETKTASDNIAIATEVRALRDEVIALANTKAEGRYIFSGSRVDLPAFSLTGDTATYQGDDLVNRVEVEQGASVRMNVVGSEAFDTIFANIEALLNAIDGGDIGAIQSALDNFKAGQDGLEVVRAGVGSDLRRTQDAPLNLDLRESSLQARKSKLQDVDTTEALTRMTMTETALRAALSSGSTIRQQNLFDYLV